MTLIDAGIVKLARRRRQKFAFVFEKPIGRKLLDTPDGVPYKIAEDNSFRR